MVSYFIIIYIFIFLFLIILDLPTDSKIQKLLFSATFSKEIKKIVGNFLKDDYLIASSDLNNNCDLNKNIIQKFIYVEEDMKIFLLHYLLQRINGTVISK